MRVFRCRCPDKNWSVFSLCIFFFLFPFRVFFSSVVQWTIARLARKCSATFIRGETQNTVNNTSFEIFTPNRPTYCARHMKRAQISSPDVGLFEAADFQQPAAIERERQLTVRTPYGAARARFTYYILLVKNRVNSGSCTHDQIARELFEKRNKTHCTQFLLRYV